MSLYQKPLVSLLPIFSHSRIELILNVGHPFEIGGSGGGVLWRIFGFELLCQIIQRFYGLVETRDCKESRQVRCVRGNHDEAEHPPGGSHESSRESTRSFPSAWNTNGELFYRHTPILLLPTTLSQHQCVTYQILIYR